MSTIAANLATNVRRLRDALGLSQQQIAAIAGVPRPTWANLESGEANPTIAVLVKAASALNVDVEKLLRPPPEAARVIPAEVLKSKRRGHVAVRDLLPEPVVGLELERLSLPPRTQINPQAHPTGSHKYAICEVGELSVTVGKAQYAARTGDVVVFRGDQSHGFRNTGRSAAVVYCVVTFAGTD
jgi:transcriptional regulator with XRE-family HTH domain